MCPQGELRLDVAWRSGLGRRGRRFCLSNSARTMSRSIESFADLRWAMETYYRGEGIDGFGERFSDR